ncbi:hypothetical protein P7K49_033607 [Saguinus oedipus]|uniref:Uncharacterized protein n=1 Tax=Saguinus oedipus TaxID=9490 RepID=A0ABQ9TT48_SAGOE|nr:hypothetical protein P7K49_033607 [Saguinus oedipus]
MAHVHRIVLAAGPPRARIPRARLASGGRGPPRERATDPRGLGPRYLELRFSRAVRLCGTVQYIVATVSGLGPALRAGAQERQPSLAPPPLFKTPPQAAWPLPVPAHTPVLAPPHQSPPIPHPA